MTLRSLTRAAAVATVAGLALTARALDAVRLELQYRLDGRDRTAPEPRRQADDEPLRERHGVRHDNGASGRWGG